MTDVFGNKLGQYVLLEQLGEGGMAKVYNAFDTRVEQNVAIKVILPSKRSSSIFLQQFEREAKVLANLTHTNIVKVLNYGIENGQPYLVMEYVPGGTLREALNQKLPWQTAAAILAPIARALDYVHQQQIVHRDVKPSNILLQEDFRPMLSDFGILKLLESKDEKPDSAIGAGIGTPEYMAPEQGMGKDVDFRADIYSLGLVFYEMVTGQKPYTADSPMAVVIKHLTDQIVLPSRIDRTIPRFVERAIMRAVQKDPRDRYISMGHFADVLELIALGDKAPTQKIARAAREREKRQRSISILYLSIILLILVIGTTFFTLSYLRGQNTATPPPTALLVPVQATVTSTRAPTQTVVPVTTEAPVATPEITVSSNLTRLGTPIVPGQNAGALEIARWGIGGVNVVRWSPDGKTVALGTTSGIFMYDAESLEETLFINAGYNVRTLSYNIDGDEIAAGSPEGVVDVWDARTGQSIRTFSYVRPESEIISNINPVTAITYSADGSSVAIGYGNGAINYFPAEQATVLLAMDNYPRVEDLVISADNRFIYASNGSREVTEWDIQLQTKDVLENPGPVDRLSLSADQQFLLAGGRNSVYVWDFVGSDLLSSFSNLGGQVTDVDISHDNQFVSIALNTGEITVFAMPSPADYSKTQRPLHTVKGYSESILSLAASPDALRVATGNIGEGLKLWNAQTGEMVASLDQSRRAVEEIYLSHDGLWLATAHDGGTVQLWNVNEAKEAYPPFEGYLPRGEPFSPDNRFMTLIRTGAKNQADVIQIVELKTGKIVAELPGYLMKDFVRFTDDTKILVTGNAYSAAFWDVTTWEKLYTHGGPNAGCGQFFTPQNQLLSIISESGIMFYDFDAKMEKMCGSAAPGATLVYYFYDPNRVVFVLGADKNGEIWEWNFVSDDLGRVQSNTPYPLVSKIFLAADQTTGLYAYVADGEIHVKYVNGSTAMTIGGQEDYQYRLAMLPGKKLVALGSKYGSIHIWSMP